MTKEAATPETTTETAAPVEKAPKITQHGITRPKADSITGRVWAIADELSAAAGKPAARKDVMEAGLAEKLNGATIATQYGKWRKFNGLKRPAKVEKPAVETVPVDATGAATKAAE